MAAFLKSVDDEAATSVDIRKPRRYTVRDLRYENTLEELVAQNTKFLLVGFHTVNTTLFDIMPVETGPDESFRLQEEILDAVEEADKLVRKPKTHDIVLAPKEPSKFYYRCMIIGFQCKELAKVYYIDDGGFGAVEVTKLKPVTDAVMQYKRISYAVALDDMFSCSNYILWSDHNNLMQTLKNKKTQFTVEFGSPLEKPGSLYCDKKVKLTYMLSRQTFDLRNDIKELAKWEWETYSNLCHADDDEICEKGNYGKPRPLKLIPAAYPLSVGERFPATVSSVMEDEAGGDVAVLTINLLTLSTYFNSFNVLHHQLARYAQNIKQSSFFPSLQETFIINFASSVLKENKKFEPEGSCAGMWFRAVRVSDENLYLFDIDEYVPYKYLKQEDYTMRRMYVEFLRVPALSIAVRPKDRNQTMSVAQAKRIFLPGSRFNFVVTKNRAKEFIEMPYEVEFSEADATEKETKIEQFFYKYDD